MGIFLSRKIFFFLEGVLSHGIELFFLYLRAFDFALPGIRFQVPQFRVNGDLVLVLTFVNPESGRSHTRVQKQNKKNPETVDGTCQSE